MAALLLASLLGAWQTRRVVAEHQASVFDYEISRIESAVAERMNAYVQVLRGGLGLFQVTGPVSREDWLRYVDTLQLAQRYPGFKSLSFAAAVRPQDVDAFIARIRAEPLPAALHDPRLLREFALRAPGGASSAPPLHAPIIFVAPMIPENERVLGVDMMQEPSRRAAMERAASTGMAILSPRLSLAGQGDRKAGFIAYLAVRQGDVLQGWLTAAFRADDFMRGLLGTDQGALEFEVYDGAGVAVDSLLYSTEGIDEQGAPRPLAQRPSTPLTRVHSIQMPGERPWTLRYRAPGSFVPFTDRLAPWLLLAGGLLATLLFHATARSGLRLRRALDQVAAQNQRLKLEVQERQRAEAEVRHQATHDPLTGVANRSLFMDRLESAIERARRRDQPFALAYLDVDGFKGINDGYGHQFGDELLKAIAARLQARLRKEDCLARLGGDEFAILLEQALDAPAAARELCAGIVASLCEPFALAVQGRRITVRVGASVGVALFPQHGPDCDRLIEAADSAMYRAKRGGRNACVLAGSDALLPLESAGR